MVASQNYIVTRRGAAIPLCYKKQRNKDYEVSRHSSFNVALLQENLSCASLRDAFFPTSKITQVQTDFGKLWCTVLPRPHDETEATTWEGRLGRFHWIEECLRAIL